MDGLKKVPSWEIIMGGKLNANCRGLLNSKYNQENSREDYYSLNVFPAISRAISQYSQFSHSDFRGDGGNFPFLLSFCLARNSTFISHHQITSCSVKVK
jgi:hypothetical protein